MSNSTNFKKIETLRYIFNSSILPLMDIIPEFQVTLTEPLPFTIRKIRGNSILYIEVQLKRTIPLLKSALRDCPDIKAKFTHKPTLKQV